MPERPLFQTARSVRHLIARLEQGEEVIEALQAAALANDASFATVRGHGAIEDAVLSHSASERPEPRSGLSEVLSLEGHIVRGADGYRAQVFVLLSQGTQLNGGQLVRAHARSLDLMIECLDGVRVGAPRAETASTMDEAARAERGVENTVSMREEAVAVPEPEVGDLLDHPSFGLVELEAEEDSGRVKIKLASGSMREIMLDVFEVLLKEPRDGKRLFGLRPRRR